MSGRYPYVTPFGSHTVDLIKQSDECYLKFHQAHMLSS